MKKKFIYDEDLYPRSLSRTILVTAAGLILTGALLKTCLPEQTVEASSTFTKHDKFATYFKAWNSPVPEVMAQAVMQTKMPALMAAVAVKESNATPWAVGDSGRSKGAFQVQAKHWGDVPIDPIEQALQAERILEDLMRDDRRGSLRRSLARYNGGTRPPKVSYKYADHVIKLTQVMDSCSARIARGG